MRAAAIVRAARMSRIWFFIFYPLTQIANIKPMNGEAIIKADDIDAPTIINRAPTKREVIANFIFNPLKIAPRFVGLDVTITQS